MPPSKRRARRSPRRLRPCSLRRRDPPSRRSTIWQRQSSCSAAIIMGDAAFVARPHVGAGVTKAALDAACLADALQEHDSRGSARALRRYAQARGRLDHRSCREFGATCIHGKTDGAGRMQRAERAWQEYLHMPDRIHEWGLEALAAE